jgi:hypothetical protein
MKVKLHWERLLRYSASKLSVPTKKMDVRANRVRADGRMVKQDFSTQSWKMFRNQVRFRQNEFLSNFYSRHLSCISDKTYPPSASTKRHDRQDTARKERNTSLNRLTLISRPRRCKNPFL